MISELSADDFTCEDLKSETTQLGVILYPPDRLNEKFLIKIRQCILNLSENHPVKLWLKTVARPPVYSEAEEKKRIFVTEILTSKFNLITDLATKNKIIEVLLDVPENTLAEKFLKSYLYLMIGNVTRADNVLREILRTPPEKAWLGYPAKPSLYHVLTQENLESMITKVSGHPSDRKTWELFNRYLQEFFNDPRLLEKLKEHEGSHLDGKLGLLSVKRIAPEFVTFLRLKRLDTPKLVARLRKGALTFEDQAKWVWYFLPIEGLASDELLPALKKTEETAPLWFSFLMEDERLGDFYSARSGKSNLSGKRIYLRSTLQKPELFMTGLWKLIGLGAIDQELVRETIEFLKRD